MIILGISAYYHDSAACLLKDGVVINPMCMVGPKVSIGRCVYINYQVGIGHD